MDVYCIVTGKLYTNTYIVVNNGRAFIVDPGADFEKIKAKTDELGVKAEAVLLTHGHFDHTNAAVFFQSEGAQVFCHKNDLEKLSSIRGMAFLAGETHNKLTADVSLCGGETLNITGLEVKVIWTPGHSAGGVCYVAEDSIFCGDTVFFTSYGRTDFYDGSFAEIKNSILNKLFKLDRDYVLYPGHGEQTSLSYEKEHNEILFGN